MIKVHASDIIMAIIKVNAVVPVYIKKGDLYTCIRCLTYEKVSEIAGHNNIIICYCETRPVQSE